MSGRRGVLSSGWLPILIVVAVAAAGCGAVSAVVAGGRDGPKEATLGGAYVPAGFGEGSVWATDIFTCDDTSVFPFGGGSASCATSAETLLKRLDPRTGEEEAAVPMGDFFANTPETAFGAGSVWVSSADYSSGPVEKRRPWDAVYRVDPETNRLVDRIPVDAPTGVAFGHGSVWSVSAGHGTLSRVDPETGEVLAEVPVGRGAVDVAADEKSGAVWVAGLHLPEDYEYRPPPGYSEARKLTRVDPETNRVVAQVPIRAGSPDGGAQNVAAGEGAVWVASTDGRLFEVDPETNGVVAAVRLGAYASDLEVSGGSVWVSGQNSGTWLKRVNPRSVEVDWGRGLGPADSGSYGRLAADGAGRVWFVQGRVWKGEGEGTLTRISP